LLNILADENILFVKECFGSIGNVTLMPGRQIRNQQLKKTDALIVRSVTKVNEELLKNTNIKFVGTATIGEDHINKEYLKHSNIGYSNAKGCNSQAVTEYLFSALAYLIKKENFSFLNKSIGIVGVGNIGSRVAKISEAIGLNVLKNDPPLQRKLDDNSFVNLKEALSADIVTFHVPLNVGGTDNTYHLLNKKNISQLNPRAILINTSRGAVIETNALLEVSSKEKNLKLILDVWENEPNINLKLLRLSRLATPHIAGYSYEGKVNGTVMIYNALCKFFNLKPTWQPPRKTIGNNKITITPEDTLDAMLVKIFTKNYLIEKDDAALRKILLLPKSRRASYFDSLRKNYPLRYELNNFSLQGGIPQTISALSSLLNIK